MASEDGAIRFARPDEKKPTKALLAHLGMPFRN
jgi:hypothetical protein